MSHSDEPVKISNSSKNSQRTQHYLLKPSLHPHGWKLDVKEGTGTPLFKVLKHPTIPTHYKLYSFKSQNLTPWKIKITTIEDVIRYTLFDETQEQFSIRKTPKSPIVLFRNRQRNTLARFSPLSSEIILLRTPTTSVAQLRFKERPPPLHFQVECETEPDLQWLYAIILYVIARIEMPEPAPHPTEKSIQKTNKAPPGNKTATP